MSVRQKTAINLLSWAACLAVASIAYAQAGAETFTATATVKTAGNATATAPVTITITRKMSESETEKIRAAFTSGGLTGLRNALSGVPPTGSVKIGNAAPTPARITMERATDKGRLLTVVTDQPLLFVGAGVPGAKPKAGYDFAVVDIEVDAKGSGSGTISPAAKVGLKQGAFVVEDYAVELVQLTGVTKAK